VALAGGSTAYALDTAATAHNGSIPSAGPTVASGQGGPGGGFGPRGNGTARGGLGGNAPAGGPPGGFPGASGGALPGAEGATFPGTGGGAAGGGLSGELGSARAGGAGAQSVSPQLAALLKATTTRWAAATIGSQSAAPLELATGKAVIAIGGFSGSDNAPTLAQFEQLVTEGKVHYFIAGGGIGGGPGGGGSGSAIASWVEAHYASSTVGGMTVYDLTK
jgi:hypothetical protein